MSQEHRFVSTQEIDQLAADCADRIIEMQHVGLHESIIYGIPRGGIPAAFAVARWLVRRLKKEHIVRITDDPREANLFIDDLVDSGSTRERYKHNFQNASFHFLINKQIQEQFKDRWIVFPWEGGGEDQSATVEDNILRILQYIGEDVQREGLRETPQRVVKALGEWFQGYKQEPIAFLKAFLDGSEKHQGDEMVILNHIPVYSHCEHHLAPIIGEASVGYIPQGKILGLSKIARVVDCFARRLQVQERLTAQIADIFDQHLSNRGVGVVIKAQHLCMDSRGAHVPGVITITSAMRGNLLLNQATRQEFLVLSRSEK